MRDAPEVFASDSGGTYVVQLGTTFGGEREWPALPPGRVATGGAVQITRPSLNRHRVLTRDESGPAVSNDGLCVAYAADGGRVLRVWDLQTDRTFDVLTPGADRLWFSGSTVSAHWMEAQRRTPQSQ